MAQQRNQEKFNLFAFSLLMVFVALAAYQIYCIYKYDASNHTRSSQARNIFELLKKP
ncbi:MAG: hypothetical protein HRU09_19640 [Oligoflexales bacterium]|nr:hypothetical protein [Oligoflexales bacterium]